MAKMYYYLIKKGKKTIDDVPPELREEVQKLLEQDRMEPNVEQVTVVFVQKGIRSYGNDLYIPYH